MLYALLFKYAMDVYGYLDFDDKWDVLVTLASLKKIF